jgi:hypothetical protein
MTNILSNIIHKVVLRVANLEQIAGGFKEANRKRYPVNITANNTAVDVYTAPWKGSIESLVISSPASTTSASGNHVTVTIKDVTLGTTLFTWDSFTNLQELVANTGILIPVAGVTISPTTGLPGTIFNQYDELSITIQVTGTPGITSSSVLNVLFTIFPTDHNFAF